MFREKYRTGQFRANMSHVKGRSVETAVLEELIIRNEKDPDHKQFSLSKFMDWQMSKSNENWEIMIY